MKTLNKIVSKNKIRLAVFAVALGALATGCQTYQQQNHVIDFYRAGNLTNAVVEAEKMAQKNATDKDAVIWLLEEATVMRANGQYEDSNKAFDLAEDKIDKFSEAAKVRLGQEAGALLSNQANLDYEGRYYDGIMLDTYRALNYLALGNFDNARPAIIRAYQRQQDAVEDNKKRIEKTQDAAAKDKNNAAIEKAQNNPKLEGAMQSNYSNLDSLKPYADYVNPFTVYLDGLYFMANAADASDLEHAHKSFERVSGFLGDNDYVKQDLAAMDGLMNGKPLEPTTYVIFETGCAPVRDQFRIDLPIIAPGLGVASFNAAFPTLKFQDGYTPGLTISCGTNTENTELLCSMDSVIGLDFKNELPLVVTKTIASSITKTILTQASAQAAGQAGGDFAKLFVQLSGAIYNASVNIADERTWTTLPKEFQFCRIPTPADRKLDISTADGLQKTTVTLDDGTINLVYVKSINPATPLIVSQFKLNGSTMFTPPAPAPAVVPTPEAAPVTAAAGTTSPAENPAGNTNQMAAPAENAAPVATATETTSSTENAAGTNQTMEAAAAPAATNSENMTPNNAPMAEPAMTTEQTTNVPPSTETANTAAGTNAIVVDAVAAVEPTIAVAPVAETNAPVAAPEAAK